MREFIVENLTNTEALSMTVILMNNVMALIAAFFIMFTYKVSYTGSVYSRKFNVSLGAVTIITAMIMSIISNNVALSLGMVGALSIIRFRTAVKDVRDATYIFWAIAAGIGCGVSQYTLIAVGSVFLLVFLLLTRRAFDSGKQLLVVHGDLETLHSIEAAVDNYFDGKIHAAMRNMTPSTCELVFPVGEGQLRKGAEKSQMDITEKLLKINGIRRINLVEQKEELVR